MTEIDASLKRRAIQHPGRVAGRWYQLSRAQKSQGAAYVANRLYFVPVWVNEEITIDQLGIRIQAAGSGGNIKGGIWASDPETGKPTGAPVVSFGDTSTSSTGAVTLEVTNTTLQPGLYFMGTVADNSNVICSTVLGSNVLIGMSSLSNAMFGNGNDACGYYVAHTYANALPDMTGVAVTDYGGIFGAAFAFKAG